MAVALKLVTKDAKGSKQTRTIIPRDVGDGEVIGDTPEEQRQYLSKLANLYQPLTSETVVGYEIESIAGSNFDGDVTVSAGDTLDVSELLVHSDTTTAQATLVIKFAKSSGGTGSLNIRNPLNVYDDLNDAAGKVSQFAEYVTEISHYNTASSAALKVNGEEDLDI